MNNQNDPQSPDSPSDSPSDLPSDSIPEDSPHDPLFTLSASTILTSLPTSATQILDHYSRPLLSALPTLPSTNTTTPSNANANATSNAANKVTIALRAIGSTPSLKQTVYRISGAQQFQVLLRFMRKQLKCKPSESLFCYVNSSFSPALDEPLANLFANFAVEGKLHVSYCYTVAFG